MRATAARRWAADPLALLLVVMLVWAGLALLAERAVVPMVTLLPALAAATTAGLALSGST
ncbi:MAG TPA: hypothetical protein VFJ22_17895 [Dermatophilaceae bacterium]|nr:hypothetical protein [Dermatophilaceae bacterium]